MSERRTPLLALCALLVGCAAPQPSAEREPLAVAEQLGSADAAGFRRAIEPRRFRFPEDHGPHDGFRTEWWYYTGNLRGEGGRRIGYQLTFFRSALAPDAPERPSEWATSHAWMGHFAVTDAGGERFRAYERFAREALGLAGARAEPFRVWLEDWTAERTPDGMRLRAAGEGSAIDLELAWGKSPVLQGDAGLSRKGSEPGNASYYYSMTRMPTRGQVTLGDRTLAVSGESWMDREWSTSVLEPGQVGWDWFAIQLSDGRDLMLYQIRRADGSADPNSAGTLVAANGDARPLTRASWRLETLATWGSPRSGVLYPAAWKLSVPGEQLELEIRPLMADQEIDHSFRYWEGAVEVEGTNAGEPVEGRGYVELTGYGSG